MKNSVIMVSNPVSGGIDKSEFINATAIYAKKVALDFILYETTGIEDVLRIKELYTKFKPERVIIAGGDGTVRMVVEALESLDVIFGILPAGSANGLAVELNLNKTLEENIIIAFKNEPTEIDVIIINGNKCLHLSDLGLNAKLIKNYESEEKHGRWGYFLQAFYTLINREKPFSAMIAVNDQIVEYDKVRMIVIANSKKYGTGVIINPNGLMNDGKFELIVLKNLNIIVFAKIITGNRSIDPKDMEIISTKKAHIKTNTPVNFQIDGEFCGNETELKISVSPRKIKIAIP